MKLLTTLALIKTNIENKQESILDSYIPFIRYYISKVGCVNIDILNLRASLADEFGFSIPIPSLKLMLNKMVRLGEIQESPENNFKSKNIQFDHGEFDARRAAAREVIGNLVTGLIQHAKDVNNFPMESSDAENALLEFMQSQSISCISSYVHEREIAINGNVPHEQFCVASFVEFLRKNDRAGFDALVVITIGRLGANLLNGASVCDSTTSLKETTIYFDTPWLIKLLGFVGPDQQEMAIELLSMCKELGAQTATFTHLRGELDNVLYQVEGMLSGSMIIPPRNGKKDTDVYSFCKERRISKSDVSLWRSALDDKLNEHGIAVYESPQSIAEYSISDTQLREAMDDVGLHSREDTKRTDIDSIYAIYQLRKGVSPRSIEKSIATLCTTNSTLSRAAFVFGKSQDNTFEVSSVVTDFSLCNLLWFKFPSKLSQLPEKILTANCSAAMMPTPEYIAKFDSELNKILAQGQISETTFRNFRYNTSARDHLLNLTKGDPDELTEEQIQAVIHVYDENLTRPLRETNRLLVDSVTTTSNQLDATKIERDDYATRATAEQIKNQNFERNMVRIIGKFIDYAFFVLSLAAIILTVIGKIHPEYGLPAAIVAGVIAGWNHFAKLTNIKNANFSKMIGQYIVLKLSSTPPNDSTTKPT